MVESGIAIAQRIKATLQTTINKTVTVNAPLGTTVIYQDSEPVHRYGYPYPPYPRPYPARRIYRY